MPESSVGSQACLADVLSCLNDWPVNRVLDLSPASWRDEKLAQVYRSIQLTGSSKGVSAERILLCEHSHRRHHPSRRAASVVHHGLVERSAGHDLERRRKGGSTDGIELRHTTRFYGVDRVPARHRHAEEAVLPCRLVCCDAHECPSCNQTHAAMLGVAAASPKTITSDPPS